MTDIAKHAPSLVSLDGARMDIAKIWLIGSLLIFSLVIIQSLSGSFGESYAQPVWEWLLPTVVPTLGMIISTLAASAFARTASDALVRRSFSRIASLISAFYLLTILALIVFRQSIAPDTQSWLAKVHMSNLWLGPLQGLVTAALGALFVAKHREKGRADDRFPARPHDPY